MILRPGAVFQGKVLGLTGNNVLGGGSAALAPTSSTSAQSHLMPMPNGPFPATRPAGWSSGFIAGDMIRDYWHHRHRVRLRGRCSDPERDFELCRIEFAERFTTSDFVVTNVAAGVDVSLTAPCFVAGTRIRTERGAVAVEALRIRDRISVALGGDARPVVWLGHRRVDCRRHPRPESVWADAGSAGAFGPVRPFRDPVLSAGPRSPHL